MEPVTTRQVVVNAWMATVGASDGQSPDNDDYNHHVNSGNTCSICWASLPSIFRYSGLRPSLLLASARPMQAAAGVMALQLAQIKWRSLWRCEPVQTAGVPNSETTALGLFETVLLQLQQPESLSLLAWTWSPD